MYRCEFARMRNLVGFERLAGNFKDFDFVGTADIRPDKFVALEIFVDSFSCLHGLKLETSISNFANQMSCKFMDACRYYHPDYWL